MSHIKKKEREDLISVLMPNWNGEKYLDKSIASILRQSYRNLELLIVDDCSTDQSWKVLQEQKKKDPRIKIFRNEKNLGIPKTRNRLFQKMSPEGKYFAILDSDDEAKTERLEKQSQFLEKNPQLIGCGSFVEIIDAHSQKIGERLYPTTYRKVLKSALVFCPFTQSSMMLKKDLLEKVGLYDESFSRTDDYELWLRILKKGFQLENIPAILTSFRLHPDQGKATKPRLSLSDSFRVRNRYLFSKKFFSLKAFLVYLGYIPAMILPTAWVMKIYKKLFVKHER